MEARIFAEQIIKDHYESGLAFYLEKGMQKYFQKKRQRHKYFCIFGGGVLGTTLCNWLQRYGIKVDYFCDNDSSKIGKKISGVPFVRFEFLSDLKYDTFVMVSVTNKGDGCYYNNDINQQLKDFPYKMSNILKFIAFYTNDYHLSYQECLKSSKKIVESLSDKYSIELFLELLKLKFVDNPLPINSNPLEKFYNSVQYFNHEYYKHTKNAVVVDCGAYDGDSLKEFIHFFQDKFNKYYCFEMDKNAFLELKGYCSFLPEEYQNKIVLYPYGVFSENRVSYYNTSTDTLGSCISEEGKEKIQLYALDEILENEKVTLIKMDIENSELPALQGAKNIINKCRPILAISIYHSTEQFFRIPCYILDNFPFYKLYLSLHTTITDDAVLYAIP